MSPVRRNPDALRVANAVLALMLFIGLPIAIAVNRYASETRSAG